MSMSLPRRRGGRRGAPLRAARLGPAALAVLAGGLGHWSPAAAQNPSPAQRDPESARIAAEDYPPSAVGESGTVQMRLTVTATGSVSRCEVVRSSGFESLDRRSCVIALNRWRYRPALRDGQPVESLDEEAVDWPPLDGVRRGPLFPAPPQRVYTPAILVAETSAMAVNDYPEVAIRRSQQGTAVLNLAISARGRVQHCVITQSAGSEDLDLMSCAIALARWRFVPATLNARPIPWDMQRRIRWALPE